MNLATRARHLSGASGLSYQASLEKIRSLGPKSSELAIANQWPIHRADAFLIDPKLDAEYRAISKKVDCVEVVTESCWECGTCFFVAHSECGYSDLSGVSNTQFCPACVRREGIWFCEGEQMHYVLGKQPHDSIMCGECFRLLIEKPNS